MLTLFPGIQMPEPLSAGVKISRNSLKENGQLSGCQQLSG